MENNITGYYAFEYEVLMKLQEKYKIKEVNIICNKQDIHKTIRNDRGELEDILIKQVEDDPEISLVFDNGFHTKIFRNIDLKSAYIKELSTDYVVNHICGMIDKQWIDKIKK